MFPALLVLLLSGCAQYRDTAEKLTAAARVEIDAGYDVSIDVFCSLPVPTHIRAIKERQKVSVRALKDMCHQWRALEALFKADASE